MKQEKTVAIIGDVHGCFYTLKNLFENIKDRCIEIFSVGDLIDRGPYSKEVVQFCIDNNIMSVRGNHEDMLLKAIESTSENFWNRSNDIDLYFYNGGDKAQESYINSRSKNDFNIYKKELEANGHLEWIKSFPLRYESKVLVISHAGIIDGGDDHTILWNRGVPAKSEKFQIFGHTSVEDIDYVEDFYINIDTACVYGNKLSALLIDKSTAKIVDIVQEEINLKDKTTA